LIVAVQISTHSGGCDHECPGRAATVQRRVSRMQPPDTRRIILSNETPGCHFRPGRLPQSPSPNVLGSRVIIAPRRDFGAPPKVGSCPQLEHGTTLPGQPFPAGYVSSWAQNPRAAQPWTTLMLPGGQSRRRLACWCTLDRRKGALCSYAPAGRPGHCRATKPIA
jgi:hypothetical protein